PVAPDRFGPGSGSGGRTGPGLFADGIRGGSLAGLRDSGRGLRRFGLVLAPESILREGGEKGEGRRSGFRMLRRCRPRQQNHSARGEKKVKGIRTIESCTRKGTGDWNEDGLILHPPAHRYGVVDGATGFDPVRDPLGRTPGRIAMETVVSTFLGEKDSASLRFLTLEANRRLRTLMQSYGVDVSDPSRRWSAAHAVVQIREDHLEWVQSGDCKIYAASRDGEVLSLAEDRVKPLDDQVLSRWWKNSKGADRMESSRNRSGKICGKTAHGQTVRGAIP